MALILPQAAGLVPQITPLLALGSMAYFSGASAWSLEGGSEFRISGLDESEANFPRAARLNDDSLGAVWQSRINGSNTDVRFRSVVDSGALGQRISIDPDPAEKKLPGIAESNDMFQTCYSKRAPGSLFNVFVRRVQKIGVPQEPVYQASMDASVDHLRCRVLPLGNNESLVAWYKDGAIKQVSGRFLNGGIPYGSEITFSENPAFNYQVPAIARVSDRLFGIVMEKFVAPTWRLVYNTFWNDNGTAAGLEIPVTTNPSLNYVNPDLAGKNNSAVLVYNAIRSTPEFYDVERRVIQDRLIGSAEQLNVRSTNFNQRRPRIIVLDGGEEIAMWENTLATGIFAVDGIFTHSSGTRANQEFQASPTNSTEQRRPALTGLSSNKFGALWVDSWNEAGIFGRFFNLILPGTSTTGTTGTTAMATSTVATTAFATTTGAATTAAAPTAVGTTAAVAATTAAVTSAESAGASGSNGLGWLWGVIGAGAALCIGTVVGLIYRNRSREESSEELELEDSSGSSSSEDSDPSKIIYNTTTLIPTPVFQRDDTVIYNSLGDVEESGGNTPVIYAGMDQFTEDGGN